MDTPPAAEGEEYVPLPTLVRSRAPSLRVPQYDGPKAPPVFVVLESDLEGSGEQLKGSTSRRPNLKMISQPIKSIPKMGASTIRSSKVRE